AGPRHLHAERRGAAGRDRHVGRLRNNARSRPRNISGSRASTTAGPVGRIVGIGGMADPLQRRPEPVSGYRPGRLVVVADPLDEDRWHGAVWLWNTRPPQLDSIAIVVQLAGKWPVKRNRGWHTRAAAKRVGQLRIRSIETHHQKISAPWNIRARREGI